MHKKALPSRSRLGRILRQAPLFEGLEDDDLQQIIDQLEIQSFGKGELVVRQGDHTDSLYVIIGGRVDVFLCNGKGKGIIINSLGPGDAFGELAPIGGIPRQASIETTEPSHFAVISRQLFMDSLLTRPQVAMRLIERLVGLIQDLTEEVSSLALEDVYGRVVRVLHKYAEPAPDGHLIVGRLTQQDIALRVGATREMVHRIFKELKIGGYIRIEDRNIHIDKKLPPRW